MESLLGLQSVWSSAADVSAVVGQVAPPIGQGSRVRITAPSLGLNEAVGTVQEATDEAFIVQFEFPRSVRPFERSEIAAMDISIGRQRKVLQGLGVGLLVRCGHRRGGPDRRVGSGAGCLVPGVAWRRRPDRSAACSGRWCRVTGRPRPSTPIT